jgi:cardiolipin synthase A/B
MSSRKKARSYTHRNKVQLVKGGSEYFKLLVGLIDSAIHSIHLQTYIFDNDETGALVGNALTEAAQRGVQVYLVPDGYASQVMSGSFIHKLKEAGIHFKYFEPLYRSTRFYFGRRLHHKVMVIDAKHALVGGINISNRYNDTPGSAAWLDYALYVQGETAVQLYKLCSEIWKNSSVKVIGLPPDIPSYLETFTEKEFCSVRVCHNDWVRLKNQIWKSYFELFNQAQSSIIIMCSYFLPGWELLNKLSKAAKRGVKIKIILAGPSDVMLAKHAERHLYNWMLSNGFELYEYQSTILHAKLAVSDSHWVNIGSYNINDISAFAGIETNLYIRNKPFAQHVEQEMEQIIKDDCVQITSENYKVGFIARTWQRTAYQLIKVILNIFTFYFKRKV